MKLWRSNPFIPSRDSHWGKKINEKGEEDSNPSISISDIYERDLYRDILPTRCAAINVE